MNNAAKYVVIATYPVGAGCYGPSVFSEVISIHDRLTNAVRSRNHLRDIERFTECNRFTGRNYSIHKGTSYETLARLY
jgi:hypothetical protein